MECEYQCATCTKNGICDTCIGNQSLPQKRLISNNCSCQTGFYDTYPQFSDCQSNLYLLLFKKKYQNTFKSIECPVECSNCSYSIHCNECVGA